MKRNEKSKPYQGKVEQYLDYIMIKKGGLTKQQMADLTDQSVQNYNQKIKRGTLLATELFWLADMLNAEVKFVDKSTGKIII